MTALVPPATRRGQPEESAARAILAQAQQGRVVIQDYCPLADSIEGQLGQRYLQERGSQAFLGDARPVPYVVNNDGTLSRNAAAVLFANLTAADQAGILELDLGAHGRGRSSFSFLRER